MNLVPFTKKDFDFLLDWKPLKKDFSLWDAHAFTYPLSHSKLEKFQKPIPFNSLSKCSSA